MIRSRHDFRRTYDRLQHGLGGRPRLLPRRAQLSLRRRRTRLADLRPAALRNRRSSRPRKQPARGLPDVRRCRRHGCRLCTLATSPASPSTMWAGAVSRTSPSPAAASSASTSPATRSRLEMSRDGCLLDRPNARWVRESGLGLVNSPIVRQSNAARASMVVERMRATSTRIPWSVPVFSGLWSGTVTRWTGGPSWRSLTWLPF